MQHAFLGVQRKFARCSKLKNFDMQIYGINNIPLDNNNINNIPLKNVLCERKDENNARE